MVAVGIVPVGIDGGQGAEDAGHRAWVTGGILGVDREYPDDGNQRQDWVWEIF